MAARYGVRVWLALVTVYLVWGSTFIALAIVIRDLPPFLAMSVRHLVAGGVLLAFALPRGDRAADRIGRRQIARRVRLRRACSSSTGHGSLAWAQQTVPAGVAALLVGTIPIWMALFDRVAFGRRLAGGRVRRHRRSASPGWRSSSIRSARARSTGVGALVIVVQCDVLGDRLALLARRAAPEAPARLRRASRRSAEGSCSPGYSRRLGRDRRGDVDERRAPRARLPHRRRAASSASPRTSGCSAWRRSRSSRRTPTSIRSSPSRSAG